jgi:spore maturation protein CgeB
MRVVVFCHSLLSDWNHGNAHFLRGVVTELAERGHSVRVFEPQDAWSAANLVKDHGEGALAAMRPIYPRVRPERYTRAFLDLDEALDGAQLVLVHEWNDPDVVKRIGAHRRAHGGYRLLLHDTHHRTATDPEAMAAYDLSGYDGVLAFGQAVAEGWKRRGWSRSTHVWHEAADVRVFYPRADRPREGDVVWIGNWGDDERTRELEEYFFAPVRRLGLHARVHGVRYPEAALAMLRRSGVAYGGYVPNFAVPDVFARFAMTVHVPRRPYARRLPGVPTIRVFEALACAIPLVSAPWDDSEGLFTPGDDFLVARSGDRMLAHLRLLARDEEARAELAQRGLETIRAKHTCAHRVDELLALAGRLGVPDAEGRSDSAEMVRTPERSEGSGTNDGNRS